MDEKEWTSLRWKVGEKFLEKSPTCEGPVRTFHVTDEVDPDRAVAMMFDGRNNSYHTYLFTLRLNADLFDVVVAERRPHR